MYNKTFFLIALFCTSLSFSQEDTSSILLDNVEILIQNKGFKKVGLYDEEPEEDFNVRGFTQLSIFENDLTDEFWMSEGKRCVSSQLVNVKDASVLSLKWNKDLDGCDWVGFGFGWDGWSGKDIGYVADTLALELQVRSTGKPFTNLPWAFGIEDYSGQQAWLGYNTSFLQAENITQDWTKVQIPLSLFPFEENDVDLTSIKQLLIQVFAEGVIEIKKVHLVPFSKKLKQDAAALRIKNSPKIDGDLSEWNALFNTIEGGHQFAASYNADSLFLGFRIKDATPRENLHEGGNLWKGDAIEIAYGTNFMADPKRKFLLLSDQHIGVNCGANPYVWDWKEDKKSAQIKTAFKISDSGYNVEIAIPFSQLHYMQLTKGESVGFEIAIDLNEGADRKGQERWNSVFSEGFNTSPAKWGLLLFK